MKTRRRTFLGGAVGLPAALTALMGGAAPAMAARSKRDLLGELNVRPFINAAGTYTTHSGSLMRPEVMEAIWVAAEMRAGGAYAHSVLALETMNHWRGSANESSRDSAGTPS